MGDTIPCYFKPLCFVVKKPQVLHMLTEKLHFAWGKKGHFKPRVWGLET